MLQNVLQFGALLIACSAAASVHAEVTRAPAAVPSGSILWDSQPGDGKDEIYVMPAGGGAATQLTNNSFRDSDPSASPDGSRIVFSSDRDGQREIYSMTSAGTDQLRLTNNAAIDIEAAWSADGHRIAFVSDRDGNFEIYIMDADGANQTRVTTTNRDESVPALSPDSTTIAFMRFIGFYPHLGTINVDGTNDTTLDALGIATDPSWSPDGSRIALSWWDANANLQIITVNPDGSDQLTLTSTEGFNWGPDWSPAGDAIVFVSDRDGDDEIFVMASDGTDQHALTVNEISDEYPDWSPVGPPSADSDGDGCPDARETSAAPQFGGDRNPLDPWDFFDVTGDGVIDLADALAILDRFGARPSDASYVPSFDRYAPDASKPWRTAASVAPHVGIDLGDVLINLQSFGHSCV